jgi:hypothetical protein
VRAIGTELSTYLARAIPEEARASRPPRESLEGACAALSDLKRFSISLSQESGTQTEEQQVAYMVGQLREHIGSWLDTETRAAAPSRARLLRAVEILEGEALRMLAEVKAVLREGLIHFERHEAEVLSIAGADLQGTLSQIPRVMERYYENVRAAHERAGWTPAVTGEFPQVITLRPQTRIEVLVSTPFWLMERDRDRNIVMLRRSADPIDSLTELRSQNRTLVDLMNQTKDANGIVVDMRQAPSRNDPAFEDAMRHLRSCIYTTYPRVAVLLVSAVGVLQVNRIGRNEGAETLATLSEEAADKFAQGLTRDSSFSRPVSSARRACRARAFARPKVPQSRRRESTQVRRT